MMLNRGIVTLLALVTAVTVHADPCGTPVHDWQAGDLDAVFTDGDRFFFGLGSALGMATVDPATAGFDVFGFSRPFSTTPWYATVIGSQAIVGSGSWVQVLDLAHPDFPVTTFERSFDGGYGGVVDVQAAGNLGAVFWWVTDGFTGVCGARIIDLSDPDQPEEAGEIVFPSCAQTGMTEGTVLHLDQELLRVYDLSDPDAPEVVAEIDRPGWRSFTAAHGDTAIVRLSDGQLLFVDFANPTTPQPLATYEPTGDVDFVEWVGGTLVMVIDAGYGHDDSLEIVDVSASAPSWLSFSEGFFDGSLSDLTCSDEYCLAVEADSASPDRLRIADIRDPASPMLGDSTGFPSEVVDLGASGSTGAAADQDRRLWMLDLGPDGQTAARLVSGVDARRADIQGSTVFAGVVLNRFLDEKSYRLQVVDAAPGAEPNVVGELEVDLPGFPIYDWLQTADEGWVAVAYDQRFSDRLDFIDVSDPSNPSLTTSVRLPFGPEEAAAAGDRVILTDGFDRLAIVDVSDPDHADIAGSLELDVWAGRVAVWGRYVFAVGHDEVVVVDAGNPRQPEAIATLEYGGESWDPRVHAVPGFLLVDDRARIWIFDVRDPTAPRLHRTIEDPPCVWSDLLDTSGGLLIQGGGACGIQTLDISECTGPESVPSVNITTSPPVPSAGDTVRFNNHTSGLPTAWLWDLGDGTTSTVEAPTRVYQDPGTYTVMLTATNAHGTSTGSLAFEVLGDPEPPVADFRWTGTDLSTLNPVQFFDESTGQPTWWSWDFGDGYRSSESDPIHTYALPGSYDVTLEVGDGIDASSVTKTVLLEAPLLGGTALLDTVGQVVAASAVVPGRHDTHWRTDLAFFNPSDEIRGLWFYFLPRGGQDNRYLALRTWVNVHPQQTVTMENVLRNHFGVEDTAGALVTEPPDLLTMCSRTFTEDADGGSYGQAVPSRRTETMPLGVASQTIVGLRQSGDFRSNIGFVNLTDRTQWFTATVVAETGDVVEEVHLTIGRFGCMQIDRALPTLGAPGLDSGYIVIDAPPEEIQAYSSVIDNRTGDAVFIPARAIGIEPASFEWVVPAVASVHGANGTRWRSQLELVNPGVEPATVTLTLIETGAHGVPGFSHDLTIESGRLVRIDDVVEGLFGLRTSGALLIESSTEIHPFSRAWTTAATDTASGGTFGQYIPAIPATELLAPDRPASVLDLREDVDFRSNVGFVNPSSEAAVIEVHALSELGEPLAATTVELDPWEHRQDNRFLENLGGFERATLVLSVPQGEVAAYGSVVDNRTGDPVFRAAIVHGQHLR